MLSVSKSKLFLFILKLTFSKFLTSTDLTFSSYRLRTFGIILPFELACLYFNLPVIRFMSLLYLDFMIFWNLIWIFMILINFLFNKTYPFIILILVCIKIEIRVLQRVVSLSLLVRLLLGFTLKRQRILIQ